MKLPKIFIKYKTPRSKLDFTARYFICRKSNLQQRWTIRGLVRWLRDLDIGGTYVLEEDPFKAVFG